MPHPRRGFMRQGGVFAGEREPFSFMAPCASSLKAVVRHRDSSMRDSAEMRSLRRDEKSLVRDGDYTDMWPKKASGNQKLISVPRCPTDHA